MSRWTKGPNIVLELPILILSVWAGVVTLAEHYLNTRSKYYIQTAS